ncbi:MAG TPA: endolytic transglycosylase MltG [Thermoleophilaceae bacterium]|nr:endolytic transglycosylase MltG [Thermoleophilaceae bacterium]
MSPGPPPVPGGRSEEERERARLEREARRSGVQAAPPREPRAAQQPREARPPKTPRAPRAPRSNVTRRRRLLLAVIALLGVALVWFLWSLFQPFHGDGSGRVSVTIPKSSGVGEIGSLLEKRGVISSSFFFGARATLAGKRGDLKPGSYTLKKDMSYGTAIDALSKGPAANVVTIVVPEGRSRREIAASLSGLQGNYLAATKRPPPPGYGARRASDLEGFLFPATYQLKRGANVKQLVTKQLAAFKQRFASVNLRAAKRKNLTPYDVLIIASLVERETAAPRERKLIASVIYNRLRAGTPLGIDATTRFQFNKWSGALTKSELASPSPYNTRNHTGLPPGPIGNPGLASMRAAAAPARSSFMFYVANPCKPGTHTFTKTLAEFNAAVARYDAARRKAGGNAPKGC